MFSACHLALIKRWLLLSRFAVVPASLLEVIQAVSSVELRCRGRAEDVGASAGKGGEGKGSCTPVPVPVPSRVPDTEEVLNKC